MYERMTKLHFGEYFKVEKIYEKLHKGANWPP